MKSPPWNLLLGFVVGCLLSLTLKYFVLPHIGKPWPSLYEDLTGYYSKLTTAEGYGYVSGRDRFFKHDSEGLDEEWFINRRVKILCFSVDMDVSKPEHVLYIIKSWAQYCDKTYIFVSHAKVFELIRMKNIKPASTIELIRIDSSNSTFPTAINRFISEKDTYSWVVYVPSYVFLIAQNLKYFLIACNADPQFTVFIGKPYVSSLSGQWSLSDRSPLVISLGALKKIAQDTDSCLNYRLDDPTCMISGTGGQLINVRDYKGQEVITEIVYENFLIRKPHADVVGSIPNRFPVSVYIGGSYRILYDLDYYIYHLKAYGQHAIQGSFVHHKNRTV